MTSKQIVQINTEHFMLFTLSQTMLPVVVTNKITSSIRLTAWFYSLSDSTDKTDGQTDGRTGGHNPSHCKVLSRKTKEAISFAFNNWKSHYYGTRAWWRHINKGWMEGGALGADSTLGAKLGTSRRVWVRLKSSVLSKARSLFLITSWAERNERRT